MCDSKRSRNDSTSSVSLRLVACVHLCPSFFGLPAIIAQYRLSPAHYFLSPLTSDHRCSVVYIRAVPSTIPGSSTVSHPLSIVDTLVPPCGINPSIVISLLLLSCMSLSPDGSSAPPGSQFSAHICEILLSISSSPASVQSPLAPTLQ